MVKHVDTPSRNPVAVRLAAADYQRMPWKNGCGTTIEIVRWPRASSLDDFAWRASIADVASDGPFSRFPGVDRILVLLAGRGMRLGNDRDAVEIRARYEPARFAGDASLDCALIDGPVRDFNLMLRRGAARGTLTVVREAALELPPARHTLCFVAAGACECSAGDEPALAGGEGETLFFESVVSAGPVRVDARHPGAVVLAASIDTR